jgi:hypothetical protein
MYFLIIQLFKTEYKEDILLAMTTCGISKGNLFEGQNIDNILEQDVPIFAGLINPESQRARQTIMITAVLDKKERMEMLIQLLEEAGIEVASGEILKTILLPIETMTDGTTAWDRGKK